MAAGLSTEEQAAQSSGGNIEPGGSDFQGEIIQKEELEKNGV